ncbi:MAG: hypothetical protein AAGA96_03660, partial [Verrucomicrobiota bacterium]
MKGKQRLIFRISMIVVIAILVYWRQGEGERPESSADQESASVVTSATAAEKKNGYDALEGVRLVDHRNNDGDSFF